MVVPAVLGAYMVIDVLVMVTTGKDIIEHVTGIDIYGPIVDPIVNFLVPDDGNSTVSGSDGLYVYMDEWGNAIIQNQDWWGETIVSVTNEWGSAIIDMLWVVVIAIVVLGILVLLTRSKKR